MDLGHCRLSTNHSKTHKERKAESVQMHGETSDHSIKDKQAKKMTETTDDHSSSKDSSSESRSSSDSEGQIDFIRRYKCINNNHSNTNINGTKCISSPHRKSSSSSSSELSSDDFFGMEKAHKYSNSSESILSSESGTEYVSIGERSDDSQKGMSPIASPSVQKMDRSGRPDASRIPPWVLDGNTVNQSEWSIASNDSLFSIQLGQPSFSREKALAYGELGLPGEFTKSNESNNPFPSIIEDEIDTAIESVVENLQTTETSHGSFKSEGEGLNDVYKSVVSSLSDSSETGICPVDLLPSKKKKKKRSRRWYFYKGTKVLCSLWPSSDWSDSCGAFSSCWNTSRKKIRPHTSPILTEAERSDSVQMDIPQNEADKLASEVTSIFTASSCCCCFGSNQESVVTSISSDSYCNWFNYFSCPSCTWMLCCTSCECCC